MHNVKYNERRKFSITSQRGGEVGHEINMKGWQCNDISSTIPKKKQFFISKYFVSLKMD
jgi:hypothetical protein